MLEVLPLLLVVVRGLTAVKKSGDHTVGDDSVVRGWVQLNVCDLEKVHCYYDIGEKHQERPVPGEKPPNLTFSYLPTLKPKK